LQGTLISLDNVELIGHHVPWARRSDEDFMNSIFSRIHSDSHGNEIPLQPLVDAMTYQYEHKQTEAIDGSKVLPFD